CGGGDIQVAHELGVFLAEINKDRADRDDSPIETIAFFTNEARDLAVLLALGCQRIVMQKEDAPGERAVRKKEEGGLGGFEFFIDKHLKAERGKRRQDLEADLENALIDLAEKQRPPYPATLV